MNPVKRNFVKRKSNVYHSLLRQNRMCKIDKTKKLNLKKIRYYVL